MSAASIDTGVKHQVTFYLLLQTFDLWLCYSAAFDKGADHLVLVIHPSLSLFGLGFLLYFQSMRLVSS